MPGDPDPTEAAAAGGLPVKRLLLVLGVVATAYAAVLLVWGDSPQASLARLWTWTGLQAAALCVLNYLLRGVRWRLWMAHYGRHFGWLQGLRLYLAGYAFTPTPGNVGEAMRGLMLSSQPLGTAQSLAIFGAERLADLLCLLLMAVPALWWGWNHGFMQALLGKYLFAMAFVAISLAVVMAVAIWMLRRQLGALLGRVEWLREAWQCLSLQPVVWFGLTLAAWLAQGLAVWLICRDFSIEAGLFTSAGFYAVAMVAGALSALPAGLGGMEAVLTGLLVAAGAAAGVALSVTVLVRLLTLWLAVAIGLAALLYSAAVRREISFR
ncbi:MAG: flippase-like domain-containing protein [Comamonadaceae bacterium]|nr:MAG: flippase-like domain-containing protein [Comamonadaceae bacterium]